MEQKIVMLPIGSVYPHKLNPRKVLGDLGELTESIRAQGILQNLTVIPWAEAYPDEAAPEDGAYVTVIGHRRAAAAKAAGVTELPCVIAHMDRKTQIGTMLLENMARADLTVAEQAESMQLMMDMGSSVAEISEKTGLSERTVQRRLQIAQLPADALAKAEQQLQLSIEDYVAVSQLRKKTNREKVLRSNDMHNFQWNLRTAREEETCEENRKDVMKELKARGIEEYKGKENPQWNSKYKRIVQYDLRQKEPGKLPKKVPAGAFWLQSGPFIYVMVRDQAQDQDGKPSISAAEKAANARRRDLKLINDRAYQSRYDFILNYSECKKNAGRIAEELMLAGLRHTTNYTAPRWMPELHAMLGTAGETSKTWPNFEKLTAAFRGPDGAKAMLWAAYSILGDEQEQKPYYPNVHEGLPYATDNQHLKNIYEMLGRLGYELADEEAALMDGTHELLRKREEQE